MKSVDLVIFDLDGTLVDSKKAIANSVNFMLKKLGLRTKKQAEIDSYIGKGTYELIKDALGYKQEYFDKGLDIFQEHFKKNSKKNTRLYPGVTEILEYFKDKKMAIITNRLHKFAELVLKDFGIRDYFTAITGGDDLKCVKPSSCPLDGVMNRLKVKKDRAIMVGDMHYDVLAGKEAYVATCAVTYGIGKKEDIEKAEPDYIIDNIAELRNIIK